MDELNWKAFLTGQPPPTKKDKLENNVPKIELEWSPEEDKQSSNTWKALNAIFNGVSPTQFKSISATESAKEAWDLLQVEVEETTAMRKSRIELLIFKFKNLLIKENETIEQYHAKTSDI